MSKLNHSPQGMRDIFGTEYERKMDLCDDIKKIFKDYGYHFIQTPALEFVDVFEQDKRSGSSADFFRMFDREGQILALRPDFTPSIARAVSMYYPGEEKPLRLCYKGNVYLSNGSYRGRLNETTEMGVELINDDSPEADAEVIAMAVDIMKQSGLSDFRISIGNAAYFRAVAKEAHLDEDTTDELRRLLTMRNQYGAVELIERQKIDPALKKVFMEFITLFGDEEVLERADSITDIEDAKKAVIRLREVLRILKKKGCDRYISFDLGMLSNYSYYTGIIFRAFTFGTGDAIIKGGRYDNFVEKFGKKAPATGFTTRIDGLLSAKEDPARADEADKDRYITIALTKGRLAGQTLDILEKAGITCEEIRDKSSRKLIFTNEEYKLKFFLAKGPDVPTFVEYGAADIGIVGKDTIIEENRNVHEVLDLECGRCRMCVCGPAEAKKHLENNDMIRVATKYPGIAKDYFLNKRGQTVEIIKMNGSIELAPIVGLSEVIVDIVETGSTLRENGLEVLETILDLSARVIVNPVSMKMEHERIAVILKALKENL